jgi:hypothetical protein
VVRETQSQFSGYSPSKVLYQFTVRVIIVIVIAILQSLPFLTPFCGTFIAVFFTDNEVDGKEQSSEWLHYGSRDHGVRSREMSVMSTILS